MVLIGWPTKPIFVHKGIRIGSLTFPFALCRFTLSCFAPGRFAYPFPFELIKYVIL